MSIEKCIENNFKDSKIRGYNCWKCGEGKVKIKSNINKVPEVLSLYFKRYDEAGNKTNFNLTYGESLNVNGEVLYLKTIICHNGTRNDGHYITLEKEGDGFHEYNDKQVSFVETNKASCYNKDIYMMFYEKTEKNKECFYSEAHPLTIPPFTEKLIQIKVHTAGTYLCVGRKLKDDLEVRDGLTKIKNDRGVIAVMNTSRNEICLSQLKLELVPWKEKKIAKIEMSKNGKWREKQRIEKLKELINTTGLKSENKEKLEIILEEYADLFLLEGEKLSVCNTVEHNIPIFTDSPIINVRPYRLPILQRTEINRQIKKMIDDNIIGESKSPWNAPLLIVPKKTKEGEPKKWRIVVDFRKLNEITISDNFPLPNINEVLDQLGKSKYFSTMDLSQGYHQIGMSRNSKELTAFSTPFGHYEWLRMPMGLKSASHTFQRLMNSVFIGINGTEAFVYLDDVVVYGNSLEIHLERLRKVFDRLRFHNLKLQPEKCNFLKKEVVYLGHKITDKGITPDPTKFEAIENFRIPVRPKDIKSFLGMVGYYRRFVPNFAEIAKPLTTLLKKKQKFNWTDLCENSFKILKRKLIEEPILQYPDFEKEFCVTTDASGLAIGAVLSQTDKNSGIELPIAYASRSLLEAETRYSTTERELLAIVWGVEHFNVYLYGRKFRILSDHKPLKWLMNVEDPSSRLMRWKIRLSKYDFEINHIKGKSNLVADSLSRNVETNPELYVVTRAAKIKETNQKLGNIEKINGQPQVLEREEENIGKYREVSVPSIIESDDCHMLKLYKDQIHLTSLEEQCVDGLKNTRKLDVGKVIINDNGYKKHYEIICKTYEHEKCGIDEIRSGIEEVLKIIEEKHYEKELYIIKHELEGLYFEEIKKMFTETLNRSDIKLLIFDNKKKYLTDMSEIQQVLKEYHDNPLGGHQGVKRMMSRISNRFKWEHMKNTIEKYVSKCRECQLNKPSRGHKIPMKITSTATRPFQKIAIDVVGPLPETENGHKYILTFQDDLTRFVGAIPIANQEADTIAREFVHHIILKFGFHEQLTVLSDMGSNFQSELFKNVCKTLKIKKYNTSPWHPESNGGLERSHRTLKEYLRSYIDKLDNWDKFVEFGIFTINSTKSETTGYSPFELLYGHKVNVPSSLTNKVDPVYNYDNYVHELKFKLQKAHEIARDNQLKMKQRNKEYYDKNSKTIDFLVGDKVLIKNNTQKGEGRKLQSLYTGPYEVTAIISDTNIRIKIGKQNKIFHKNNVKKFKD